MAQAQFTRETAATGEFVRHDAINPTRIVPAGPDLSGWLVPHDRG